MVRRIGLTGGIGSGKSTVATLWRDLGATLVDTDAIARALTAPGGRAMPAIVQSFGPSVANAHGALDRDRMRTLVFGDPAVKKTLEGLLHPLIGAECERLAAAAPPSAPIVFDVPLLVESRRWRGIVDRVVVVDAREETQLARVAQRSGWAPAAIEAVMTQQASRASRRAAADAVLFNDGITVEELAQQVSALWKRWQGLALR